MNTDTRTALKTMHPAVQAIFEMGMKRNDNEFLTPNLLQGLQEIAVALEQEATPQTIVAGACAITKQAGSGHITTSYLCNLLKNEGIPLPSLDSKTEGNLLIALSANKQENEDLFISPSRCGFPTKTIRLITHPRLRPETEAFMERFLAAVNSFTPKDNSSTFWDDATTTMVTNILVLANAAGADLGPQDLSKILASIPNEEFKAHVLAAFKD